MEGGVRGGVEGAGWGEAEGVLAAAAAVAVAVQQAAVAVALAAAVGVVMEMPVVPVVKLASRAQLADPTAAMASTDVHGISSRHGI